MYVDSACTAVCQGSLRAVERPCTHDVINACLRCQVRQKSEIRMTASVLEQNLHVVFYHDK